MYEEEKKQLFELEDKFKPLEEEYLKVIFDGWFIVDCMKINIILFCNR